LPAIFRCSTRSPCIQSICDSDERLSKLSARAGREGVLDVFDGGVLVWWPGDEDDVEADRSIGQPLTRKKKLRRPTNASLLRRMNWQLIDVNVACSRLDLDEGDNATTRGDQVDLTGCAMKILLKNPIPRSLKKPRGKTLSLRTQAKVIARRPPVPEQAF